MKIKILSLILLTLFFSSSNIVAQSEKSTIEVEDIQKLLGKWKGSLTYIDYSSNNPFSMPCELEIQPKKENRKLTLYYTYPNEPKANGTDQIKISKDRSKLDGKSIIFRSEQSDRNIQIITEYLGKDGNENKKALIRYVYIIGTEKLIIKKEVQFEGTKDWLKRNEYNFTKSH